MTTESVDVRINLPLPLSVASHIMSAFGALWPDTVIVTDHPYPDTLVVRIPDTARFEPGASIEPAPLAPEADKAFESDLTKFDSSGFAISPAQELSTYALELLKETFASEPEAANYLEMSVFDAETLEKWVVTAIRPKGATPHELRLKAEEERDTVERRVIVDLEARVARERAEGDRDGLLAGLEYALESIRKRTGGDSCHVR